MLPDTHATQFKIFLQYLSYICFRGLVSCTFHTGIQTLTHYFILCKRYVRPFILSVDFLCEHKIGVQWSDTGEKILTHDNHIHVGSLETIQMVQR